MKYKPGDLLRHKNNNTLHLVVSATKKIVLVSVGPGGTGYKAGSVGATEFTSRDDEEIWEVLFNLPEFYIEQMGLNK